MWLPRLICNNNHRGSCQNSSSVWNHGHGHWLIIMVVQVEVLYTAPVGSWICQQTNLPCFLHLTAGGFGVVLLNCIKCIIGASAAYKLCIIGESSALNSASPVQVNEKQNVVNWKRAPGNSSHFRLFSLLSAGRSHLQGSQPGWSILSEGLICLLYLGVY